LEEAAAYLEETGERLDEYLELVRDRSRELFGLDQPPLTSTAISRRRRQGRHDLGARLALGRRRQSRRVVNLSGDQHQVDAFFWANFPLKPLPERLVG
jgi:hypothetical protein